MNEAWRTHVDSGWQVTLPVGVGGGPVARLTNPELLSVAVFRGWVSDEALYVGVTTRARAHSSLRAESRALSEWFAGGPSDGDFIDVPGARGGARRVDGLMDVEEGYGEPPDWTERVTFVVAAHGKREVVILTLRRHPGAALDGVVDRVVASFRLTEAAGA